MREVKYQRFREQKWGKAWASQPPRAVPDDFDDGTSATEMDEDQDWLEIKIDKKAQHQRDLLGKQPLLIHHAAPKITALGNSQLSTSRHVLQLTDLRQTLQ